MALDKTKVIIRLEARIVGNTAGIAAIDEASKVDERFDITEHLLEQEQEDQEPEAEAGPSDVSTTHTMTPLPKPQPSQMPAVVGTQ